MPSSACVVSVSSATQPNPICRLVPGAPSKRNRDPNLCQASQPGSACQRRYDAAHERLPLIVVPYELGRLSDGVGNGPERLLEAGAEDSLSASAGASVRTELVEFDPTSTARAAARSTPASS